MNGDGQNSNTNNEQNHKSIKPLPPNALPANCSAVDLSNKGIQIASDDSTVNGQINTPINVSNLFDTEPQNDLNNESNNLIHNEPDLIVNSGDRTDFVNTSLLNNSSSLNTPDHPSNDPYKFGLLQTTSTPGKTTPKSSNKLSNQSSHISMRPLSNNATDSKSDLSSETGELYKPLIKSTHSTINLLVDKSTNELNKNNTCDNSTKTYSSFNSIKNDLKISIDNSDWLRKRRPLVADIDLEPHFNLNNDQLFNSDKSTNIMNKELNKENYCNGNMNKQEHKDHLSNDLIPDKGQLNMDLLSSSSSSNHSPNSYSDELDANKIELRSVIRNIMCKNLGSSSDKSSTMSEEDETDEDENSVDCKTKVNDMKSSGIKNLQSTIEHQENELNQSKEKSILDKMSTIKINTRPNDHYDDSVDEKDDSENYDSNNSEERTDELSSKDENTDEVQTDDQEKCGSKSNLKKQFGKKKRRVSFDPLALFLDAALEGELELVKKTATQVSNPSASSEGVTALHNSICAGHFDIVKFLVEIGCDFNAQDHDGWTPLHCAASCNNLPMVKYLVEHGACIFAVTLSDHETPAQKCEEMEDGYQGCSKYLYSMQEKLGVLNGGAVYAVYDYNAQQQDELSFKCGELLRILSKSDESETEWWWASNGQQENVMYGYVPRNLLSIYPRVSPKSKETIELENN